MQPIQHKLLLRFHFQSHQKLHMDHHDKPPSPKKRKKKKDLTQNLNPYPCWLAKTILLLVQILSCDSNDVNPRSTVPSHTCTRLARTHTHKKKKKNIHIPCRPGGSRPKKYTAESIGSNTNKILTAVSLKSPVPTNLTSGYHMTEYLIDRHLGKYDPTGLYVSMNGLSAGTFQISSKYSISFSYELKQGNLSC